MSASRAYIKFCYGLDKKPQVQEIARILKVHPNFVVGGLFCVWQYADDFLSAESNKISNISPKFLDKIFGKKGATLAMESVNWLKIFTNPDAIEFINYNEEIGSKAYHRKRLQEQTQAATKARWKGSNGSATENGTESVTDTTRTKTKTLPNTKEGGSNSELSPGENTLPPEPAKFKTDFLGDWPSDLPPWALSHATFHKLAPHRQWVETYQTWADMWSEGGLDACGAAKAFKSAFAAGVLSNFPQDHGTQIFDWWRKTRPPGHPAHLKAPGTPKQPTTPEPPKCPRCEDSGGVTVPNPSPTGKPKIWVGCWDCDNHAIKKHKIPTVQEIQKDFPSWVPPR